MSGFMKLGGMLLVSTDPLDENLVRLVTEVGGYNHNDPKILASTYQTLARVSLIDWPIIRDDLSAAASTGYAALYHCMQGMLRVYQLQNARTVNNSLSAIGQLLDQFQTTTRQLENIDRSYQKDLSTQINTFARSLAVYNENLENKILELTRATPGNNQTKMTSPPAESMSFRPKKIFGKISLIPDVTFISKYATAVVNSSGKLTLTPKTAQGAQLTAITQLAVSGKTMAAMLNLDLDHMVSILTLVPDMPQKFNSLTTLSEKREFLENTLTGIQENPTQWLRSTTSQCQNTLH